MMLYLNFVVKDGSNARVTSKIHINVLPIFPSSGSYIDAIIIKYLSNFSLLSVIKCPFSCNNMSFACFDLLYGVKVDTYSKNLWEY